MNIEFSILGWFQTLHAPLPDRLAVTLSALGNGGLIWILLTAAMLLFPKTRRAGLAMALALLLFHLLGNWGIKPLVARPRPCDLNAAVPVLVDRPQLGWAASRLADALAGRVDQKRIVR